MFEDTFYIMETSPGWFQVRMTRTHFCFSCGSNLQERLDGITRLVAKYRTEEQLLKMQADCDSGSTQMAPSTIERYRQEYGERGHLYDDDILFAVQKGLKLKQEKDPIAKARKRASLLKKTTVVKEEQVITTPTVLGKKKPLLPTLHKAKEVIEETLTVAPVRKGLLVKKINRTI